MVNENPGWVTYSHIHVPLGTWFHNDAPSWDIRDQLPNTINPLSKGPFTLKSLPGNAERTERLGNPWLKKWMFLWLYNLLYMIYIIIHRKDDIFTAPCDATVPFWRGFWWKKSPKTRKNAWKKRDIGGIPLQNCMFSVCFCSYLSTLSSPIFFRPFLASGRPL